MVVLELTLSPDYIPAWDVLSALRELTQNALDAHERGHTMFIGRVGEEVMLMNEGVVLSRACLLLGATSKRGDHTQRGQFGEGLKLAITVLCRLGLKVTIRTGSEEWRPFLAASETFEGAELLKIAIEPKSVHLESFTVTINGVSDVTWSVFQQRLLNVPGLPATVPAAEVTSTVGNNTILAGDAYRNRLYSRGIFVGLMPDGCHFGYDLADVELDRDRKLADPWSLRRCIASVLCQGIERRVIPVNDLWAMLEADSGEARAISHCYQWGSSDTLTQQLHAHFITMHGDDAIPVTNMAESIEAAHYGIKAVMVSNALKIAIEHETGSLKEARNARLLVVKHNYSAAELTAEELQNLTWAAGLTAAAEPKFSMSRLNVVDFAGEDLTGLYVDGQIRIAKKILTDRHELISTLVHEIAHDFGLDATLEHERAIERIFASMVCGPQT